jgi:heme A synthase
VSKNANKLGGLAKNQKLTDARPVVEMKIQLWFRITSLLVFLQIALGGLLTFSFIPALPHIITGFAVLVFAIVILVMALTLKPPFRPLRGLSIGMVSLIVVQIILGFFTLDTDNQVIAWVHLLVAMGIYGMVIAGTFMSMRLDYRLRDQSGPAVGPHA